MIFCEIKKIIVALNKNELLAMPKTFFKNLYTINCCFTEISFT